MPFRAHARCWLQRRAPAKHRQKRPLHGLVAGNDAARFEHVLAALGIGDGAARLAHEQHAGGDVPGLQAVLT